MKLEQRTMKLKRKRKKNPSSKYYGAFDFTVGTNCY